MKGYDSLKKVKQLKHSSPKSTSADKITTKYKTQCQMLRLLKKEGKK